MARRCERVVRRCIYSPPFHSDDSGNLRPLRLALASPSRPQSVIIVSKMVRSEGVAIVVVVIFVVVVVFVSIVLVVFLALLHQRERRGTVTLWSNTDVHRDLGWIFVSVCRCRRVWEARRGQRGW